MKRKEKAGYSLPREELFDGEALFGEQAQGSKPGQLHLNRAHNSSGHHNYSIFSCGGQYTFHKNLTPPINISITTAVRITRRHYVKGSSQPFIRASYVSLYPPQITKLKQVAQSEGKAVTELIREAIKRFLGKPAYERNAFTLSPFSTEGVKRVYPRIAKTDWDALNRISVKANRARTELVREAVDGYIGIAGRNEQ